MTTWGVLSLSSVLVCGADDDNEDDDHCDELYRDKKYYLNRWNL